jgi:leader peptidase (prepilin peptidase)/N-methyltransferase
MLFLAQHCRSRERLDLRRRWPVAETASAFLVAGCFLRYGLSARVFVAATFVTVLAVIAVVDLRTRIIPNCVVLPTAAAILAAQFALFPDHALEWTLATVLAPLPLLVIALVSPAGMGMGDVKLALLLGAALGRLVLLALLVGSIAAALVAAAIMLRRGWSARRSTIAFGPYLALGGIIAALVG